MKPSMFEPLPRHNSRSRTSGVPTRLERFANAVWKIRFCVQARSLLRFLQARPDTAPMTEARVQAWAKLWLASQCGLPLWADHRRLDVLAFELTRKTSVLAAIEGLRTASPKARATADAIGRRLKD